MLFYRNENRKVMYQMIDERLSCDILVNIEDLKFMILYFKFSSLLFPLVCFFVLFLNLLSLAQ